MKTGFFKKLVTGAVSALLCVTAIPPSLNTLAADYQEMGTTSDGYSYELWNQYGQGTAKWTLGENGAYNCEWSDIENVLFRTGKKLGSTQSYDAYDGIYIDYDVDYYPMGNSYLCVYGWTEDGIGTYPTVEYYIVEAWGSWRPPGATDSLGTVTTDGATYDIYRTVRENQPSIHGKETFYQYWSVRQTNPASNNTETNLSGTITVSNHFDAWNDAGLDVSGKLYEVALNTEGYQSNGKSNVKKNNLVFGSVPDDSDSTTPTTDADENGNYFKSTFEDGKDKWLARGDASISTDSQNYYSGSQSLFVSGRTDNWNGASISLDSNTFKAGNSYSFSTGVLQNSGEDVEMKMTLQYNLNGEENYAEVASATAKSGEWTKLENTSYKIPEGASNLLLYFEASDSLTDFYIDDAAGSVAGTKSTVVTGGGTVTGSETVTTTTNETTTTTTTTTSIATTTDDSSTTERLWGDANCDGKVTIADVVAILQNIANKSKYPLTEEGMLNGDVYNNGDGITASDALTIQQYDAGVVKTLPVSYSETVQATATSEEKSDNTETVTTIADTTAMLSSSFEDGDGKGESRGDGVSLTLDTDNFYSGSQSVKVSGRTDTWQGIATNLDSSFEAGNTYSFSAAVLQGSGSSEKMMITLQYTDKNGETQYDNIASATVGDKTWTLLENTAYTIPEGATDLLVYIKTAESLTDFYVDDVVADKEGTKSSVITGEGTVNIKETVIVPPVSENDEVDISWIDPNKPMVAISFDDGAVGSSATDPSMRIINAIADSGFHATFFYVGDWIKGTNGEDEVKYAFSKGMEIANHSTTHPYLTQKSADEIRSEFDTTHEKLKNIIGAEPSKMLRLPYLATNATVESTLNDVALISCRIDTQDWNGASANDIINTIKTAMADGTLKNSIVLCHETYNTTAEAMEYLAPYLKENGYQIVTISEMFAVNGKTLEGGKVYTKCS